MTTTIILPTYNEAENIVPLLTDLVRLADTSVSFIVVDDNSPDGTADRVRDMIHKTKTTRVRILVRTQKPGLTQSIAAGIAAAQTDAVGWMDCDFSHPPEYIPKLISEFKSGADIVLASRYIAGGKAKQTGGSGELPVSIKMSSILNNLCMRLFGSDVTDYSTGFMIAKKSVLSALPLRGDYGEYCMDFLIRAKRAGYRITEIPFTSVPRKYGQSKTAPTVRLLLRRSIGYVRTLLRLVWGK